MPDIVENNSDNIDTGSLFDDESPVPVGQPSFEDIPFPDDVPPDFDTEPAYAGYADHAVFDAAPPEEFYRPDRSFDRSGGWGAPRTPDDPEMTEKVIETIRDCFAATNGRPGEEVIDLVVYVLGAEKPLAYLPAHQLRTFKNVGQVLTSVAADDTDAEFDLFDLPDLEAAHPRVLTEMKAIRYRAQVGPVPNNPTSTWRALCDQIQMRAAATGATSLVDAITEGLPADELMKIYSSLEPPTTQRTVQNASFSKTAGEWEKQDAEVAAERPAYRISSGYRTWDYVFTLKDAYGKPAEPLGCWAPGEFHGIASPTGNGKSAISRRLVTAAAEDLVTGWGHEHAKVLIAITEEAPSIVYRAAGLAAGQPFHHLRDNVIIADVGASRRRFIHAVWDCVIGAYHMAKATGRSIVDCGMPEMIILDYIGGIVESGEGADTTAIENTANLIMRGLCGWRIHEMEQFSGESFAEYAGMSWPSGMENFRPCVITFIQTKKMTKVEFYDPEKKGCTLSDYTVENADGSPGWQVLPGDFIVPTRDDVRGSGILQNHLTSLCMAHRSRPQKNKKVTDPETGRLRLEDDRARIIFLKTRNSADVPFVPMRFDSNPEGLRGQYYDLLAEKAIDFGRVKPLPSYTQSGDPILPTRPQRSPFSGIVY